MSAFNQKYTRVMQIVPSINNIPSPNLVLQGTNTAATGFQLIDNTKNFITAGVSAGDIVYGRDSLSEVAKILTVNANSLTIDDNIFTGVGISYKIYQGSDITGLTNRGCTLMVTGSVVSPYGLITVETIGGDIVNVVLKEGMISEAPFILPFQIKKLIESSNIDRDPSNGAYGMTFYAMW
jgi:hypothetical protein